MKDYVGHVDPDWRRDVEQNTMSREEWESARQTRVDALAALREKGQGSLEGLGSEDTAKVKELLGELQVLDKLTLEKHPGHPRMPGQSRRTDRASGEFGRVAGLGAEFMKQIRPRGVDTMQAFDGTTGGATLPMPFFDPKLRELPQRQLFVRSLIPTLQVNGDKVDFMRQTVFTNAAAAVASGGLKPTSTITVERAEAPIRVIAHVSEAIDRFLLSDYDQATSFIDNQLRLGVLLAEEDQIINGNGTAPNLRGILNTSGIQTQAKGALPTPDAVYLAITKVRNVFAEPDAVVFHPDDWAEVATLRTADGIYIWGAPSAKEAPTIWGKPVITSPVIANGTALVGAFGVGAEVYEREGARVTFAETGLGDSAGQELFTRNQIRFRGESRLGLAVMRPNFFCTVTGI
jgi:HK97 family phage major capsid protein